MKKKLLHSVALLILITTNAEGAMNTPEIIKLGNVKAGEVRADKDVVEKNDPVPIVLWSANGPASVMYYNSKLQSNGGKMHLYQKILKLYGDGAGGIHSLNDVYPVTAHSKATDFDEWRFTDMMVPRRWSPRTSTATGPMS